MPKTMNTKEYADKLKWIQFSENALKNNKANFEKYTLDQIYGVKDFCYANTDVITSELLVYTRISLINLMHKDQIFFKYYF